MNKVIIMIATMALTVPSVAKKSQAKPASSLSPKEYAIQKIKDASISNEMIALLEKANTQEERDLIVQLNVLGFLKKADYSGHFSKRAVKKCVEFIRKYRKKLLHIETSYGVPKEIIAALLWVETKHGTTMGRHSVPLVYFTLIQADHPEVIKATLASLSIQSPTNDDENRQKAIDRSYAKSNWALRELKSLDELRKQYPKNIKTLMGSYAGAFGIPQFIPSSYLQWARPKLKTRQSDLFEMNDAIHSVGFYLKANGWKKENKKSQRDALFHYNRAVGYVDVIFKIAEAIK